MSCDEGGDRQIIPTLRREGGGKKREIKWQQFHSQGDFYIKLAGTSLPFRGGGGPDTTGICSFDC